MAFLPSLTSGHRRSVCTSSVRARYFRSGSEARRCSTENQNHFQFENRRAILCVSFAYQAHFSRLQY